MPERVLTPYFHSFAGALVAGLLSIVSLTFTGLVLGVSGSGRGVSGVSFLPATLLSGALTAFCMRMGACNGSLCERHVAFLNWICAVAGADLISLWTRTYNASPANVKRAWLESRSCEMQDVQYQTLSPQSICDLQTWAMQIAMHCSFLHLRTSRYRQRLMSLLWL